MKINGKTRNSTPAFRKRLNRWLTKSAGVTTSRISTPVQNCITIRLRDSLLRICKVNCQMFTRLVSIFWGSSSRYRLGRCADFDDHYIERRRFAQGCAFWASRKLNPFSQKAQMFGRFSTDRKCRLKTGFNMRDFISKHPENDPLRLWKLDDEQEIDSYISEHVLTFYPEVD